MCIILLIYNTDISPSEPLEFKPRAGLYDFSPLKEIVHEQGEISAFWKTLQAADKTINFSVLNRIMDNDPQIISAGIFFFPAQER